MHTKIQSIFPHSPDRTITLYWKKSNEPKILFSFCVEIQTFLCETENQKEIAHMRTVSSRLEYQQWNGKFDHLKNEWLHAFKLRADTVAKVTTLITNTNATGKRTKNQQNVIGFELYSKQRNQCIRIAYECMRMFVLLQLHSY